MKYVIAVGLVMATLSTFAQNKFEIGVEGGVTNDLISFEDPSKQLRRIPLVSGGGGINFHYKVSDKFYYEAALFLL